MLTDHEPDEELHPIDEDFIGGWPVFEYNDPSLVSGVLKGIVIGDLELVKKLVESGKSVNINENNGNTPLHVAVINRRLDIVKYLLTRDELVIDNKNFLGETALHISCARGHYEIAKELIKGGANPNTLEIITEKTPLHVAVHFPEICQLLIENEANIDAVDSEDYTPLFCAVCKNCVETICMLLYYNADVNHVGNTGSNMLLLITEGENYHLLEILIDFIVVDNKMEQIQMSLTALETIKIIMSSESFMSQMAQRVKLMDHHSWMYCYKNMEELITQFVCIYLEYGYILSPHEISFICGLYGYNELMRILLYMDINLMEDAYVRSCLMFNLLFRLDLKNANHYVILKSSSDELKDYLERQYDPEVAKAYTLRDDKDSSISTQIPTVPSLLDLAKRQTKRYVIQKYNIRSPCQYYTIIDHLDVTNVYKAILKHEKKIYIFLREQK